MPARWSHNTLIEVVWTLVPVLILMFIAISRSGCCSPTHDMPKPDMTIKATGYQWYWGYEYPDQRRAPSSSQLLARGQGHGHRPARLATTELVVPVNKVVRVLVTGADVIHAFAVPAFGIIIDAVPGRVNETWFKADKIGTYYGQCRELCGVDHAFMPIEVKVVSQPDFDAWVGVQDDAPPRRLRRRPPPRPAPARYAPPLPAPRRCARHTAPAPLRRPEWDRRRAL